MVEDTTESEQLQQLALAHGGDSCLPHSRPHVGLHDEGKGNAVHARDDGQKAEKVDAVKVPVLHVSEALLGQDVAENHAKVRGHGKEESAPGKAELLHGAKRASHHDGDQGCPHIRGEVCSKERAGQSHREDGLGCLDNVGKGNSHHGETDAGCHVANGVGKCHWHELLDKLAVHLGDLLSTSDPHACHPETRHNCKGTTYIQLSLSLARVTVAQ